VSWSFSCWPGPIGCVCVWWGWSGVVTALPGGAGLREVPGRRIAGRQQVHELAAAAESLSKPGVGESCPVVLAGSFPGRGTRRRRCSCLRFRGAGRGCTHLYAGSAARVARRTYIWWTASSQRASPDGVYAGHRPGGGGGRSGL